MPKKIDPNTKITRAVAVLGMLDARTDEKTRLIALNQVEQMLIASGRQWSDLAPLIIPKNEPVKVHLGGRGLPAGDNFRRGFNCKQL